ncbi:MAG: DUF2809 domain-containing protein [Caldithrix sp.]|nr:DUF2809 domain-containing protein [Caldithrix sp.]
MLSIFSYLHQKKWTFWSLLIITPLGFYTKFYSGPLSAWVNHSLGGVLYVVFWCLIVFLLIPRVHPFNITAAVFTATCLIEFTQRLDTPLLQAIRSHFLGRALIGTSFSWLDCGHYLIGLLLAWLLLTMLRKTEG